MTSVASDELVVNAGVREFLREHAAEVEFHKVIELARASFPELLGMETAVQEDPDEEARVQVVVRVRLPESFPDELLKSARRRYHERVVEKLPLARCPLFALVTDFGPE